MAVAPCIRGGAYRNIISFCTDQVNTEEKKITGIDIYKALSLYLRTYTA
jgi:hypothetical protein